MRETSVEQSGVCREYTFQRDTQPQTICKYKRTEQVAPLCPPPTKAAAGEGREKGRQGRREEGRRQGERETGKEGGR